PARREREAMRQPYAGPFPAPIERLLDLAALLGEVHMDRRGRCRPIEAVDEIPQLALGDRANAVRRGADPQQLVRFPLHAKRTEEREVLIDRPRCEATLSLTQRGVDPAVHVERG